MDRYHRVEKPRNDTPISQNEIRITTQGRMRNYISYGMSLLEENGHEEINIKAMGRAINKTVMVVELIKRRVGGLHQNTVTESVDITDTWEPLEEGLLPLETTRHVSMITVTLSKKPLDTSSPGYQPPIPAEEVKPAFDYDHEESYPPGRGRGRGGGRRGRGRGMSNGPPPPAYGYNEEWEGTMKSRMNTMTSPKNMARLLAAGVAGEEGVRHPGVGVVAQAVGHHVAAEVATISLRSTSCQVGGVLKQSTAVLSYPLAFALHVILWSLPDWNGPIWYPLFQMLLYFLLLCCAVLCLCDSLGKFLWLARGFVARLASEVTLGSTVLFTHLDDMRLFIHLLIYRLISYCC
ncbi:unnamed protein product [Urochloa humidicola]